MLYISEHALPSTVGRSISKLVSPISNYLQIPSELSALADWYLPYQTCKIIDRKNLDQNGSSFIIHQAYGYHVTLCHGTSIDNSMAYK